MLTTNYTAQNLIEWYKKEKRDLPFRHTKNPYKIWISEIMLQQTKVATVIPYYKKWVYDYPSIKSVAESNLDDLLKNWEGLGYYNRCRNIYSAAKIILEKHGGLLPDDYRTILSLPGFGEYTAGAVLSIAYDKPHIAIDGNVKRVISRVIGIKNLTTKNINRIKITVQKLMPLKNCGDFNQALIEIGALICSPKNPRCLKCPLSFSCKAKILNKTHQYPAPKKKKIKPHYIYVAALIWDGDYFLIRKRDNNVMLGGLWEFPGGRVQNKESIENTIEREIENQFRINTTSYNEVGCIVHSYSHFSISLHLFSFKIESKNLFSGNKTRWIKRKQINNFSFSKANHKLFTLLNRKDWNV